MAGLLKALRVLGPTHLWKLRRAQALGTPIERGFFATRVIQCLFNLGFFDELTREGRVDLPDFALRFDLDLRILRLLCDYLYSLHFLDRRGENTYLPGRHTRILCEVLRGTFDIIYAYEDLFHHLEAMARKEKAYGKQVKRREEFVGKGSGQSAKLLPFPMAADLIRRKGFQKILDLGCGDGEFLIGLAKADENVRGYGVDISAEVVELASRRILEAGLADRIQIMVGDIFDLEPIRTQVGQPDAATSFYVLHEFLWNGPEVVIDLLRKLRKTFPGMPLITCEITQVQPEQFRRHPSIILEHHLFHDLSQQGSIPRQEWKRIFVESGYSLEEEVRMDFSEMSIFHLC
jgi:SAM-dependent methyltransferase